MILLGICLWNFHIRSSDEICVSNLIYAWDLASVWNLNSEIEMGCNRISIISVFENISFKVDRKESLKEEKFVYLICFIVVAICLSNFVIGVGRARYIRSLS